jgi:hypothetical protein
LTLELDPSFGFCLCLSSFSFRCCSLISPSIQSCLAFSACLPVNVLYRWYASLAFVQMVFKSSLFSSASGVEIPASFL